MDYHLYRRGKDQGVFSLEELRRRHEAGELTGNEPVWAEGMGQWQPLRAILQGGGAAASFPAASSASSRSEASPAVTAILILAGVMIVAAVIGVSVVGYRTYRAVSNFRNQPGGHASSMEAAQRPVAWTANTKTWVDVRNAKRSFRVRQYIAGYNLRGQRDPECDLLAQQFLTNWIASNYGGPIDTNLPPVSEMADRLAKDPACQDPVVLSIASINCPDADEAVQRLERAVNEFEGSKHLGYPKFFATVTLADKLAQSQPNRVPELDAKALEYLRAGLTDGSIQSEDLDEIADILISDWGKNFFARNVTPVCTLVQQLGSSDEWLALVLKGESEINEAWRARGGGLADSVTTAGWQGFNSHLASARECLTRAWKLRPELPRAPDRMIYVSLGDSGIREMRTWFDRTTAAQLDYADAYIQLRWGLRPRWYGDTDSMLALGVTALKTHRFDTDVPRMFFDSLSDVESEMGLAPGDHIYEREDIWPHLQELYEGYVSAPSTTAQERDGWRTSYAVVADLAGKYNVAAEQMEALNWKPKPDCLSGWNRELSLLPEEIAARTRTQAAAVNKAESDYEDGDWAGALQVYQGLLGATNLDALTDRFVRERTATLEMEQHLQGGSWVDFLPADDGFTGWHAAVGNFKRLPDGSLQVQSDHSGYIIYSRANIGPEFEIRGQFEVVRSNTGDFQSGLMMGFPDYATYNWYGFRMKRNRSEGDVVAFSRHWTQPQITKRVSFDETNSFDVRFQQGRLTATLNGQDVFNNVLPPKNTYINTNRFFLGVGAGNDYNSTLIRYHNVQARRL